MYTLIIVIAVLSPATGAVTPSVPLLSRLENLKVWIGAKRLE